MPEDPQRERDRVSRVFRHIAEGSFPIARLAKGELRESPEEELQAAQSHLEAFIAGVDSLKIDPAFPPGIRAHAQASLDALLAGDYELARREGGWAGSLTEVFIANRYPPRRG